MSTTTTALASAADYAAADRKGKAAIRTAADRAMREAIGSGDLTAAMAAKAALDSYTTSRTSAPVEVDWQSLVADRIATLNAAIADLKAGDFDGAPEGFTFDGTKSGNPDMDAARKLTKVSRATRRDLGSLIESVVTDAEGFLTVAGIRAAIVEATDGDYTPSDGAIAARLFPHDANGNPRECTLTGVTPVEATATAPRGAVAAD